MWWLIRKILFGHIHKWETLNYYQWTDTSFGGRNPQVDYRQRCEICGDIRTKTVDGWIK